jgi:WD40 repeat protein
LTAEDPPVAKIWEVSTGEQLATFEHDFPVGSVAFSPDGQRIVTASEDGTARVWDATSGEEVAVIQGNTERISSAVFGPDGTWVFTYVSNGTAGIWDAASGVALAEFPTYQQSLDLAVLSPDGRWIGLAGTGGTGRYTLRVYDVSVLNATLDALFALADTRVTRDLTADERRQFLHE